MKKIFILVLVIIGTVQCQMAPPKAKKQIKIPTGQAVAYFASGCFWCVEGVYDEVFGVTDVVSGYAGGQDANPSYYDHGNHAETVAVIYDPNLVSYQDLVQVFFEITNPYTVGQAPDFGKSYRSILFPTNDAQKKIVDQFLNEVEGHKIEVQLAMKHRFTFAEDYHQNYVARLLAGEKVVNKSYGMNVSLPRRQEFIDKTKVRLKER